MVLLLYISSFFFIMEVVEYGREHTFSSDLREIRPSEISAIISMRLIASPITSHQ